MSDSTRDHDRWIELAAGHAVHALEPDEEAMLAAHLAGCSDCQAAMDGYAFVAAQLGSLSSDAERAPSWDSIRPRLSAPEPFPTPITAAPGSGRSARRVRWEGRSARLLAVAAAVTLIAGGVTATQLIHGSGRPAASTSAAGCRAQPGCHLIALHGQSEELATVLVSDGHARLVSQRLKASAANRMYVLWQLPRDGAPIPLLEFRTPTGSLPTGTLARSYADTTAFAISIEPAAQLPAHPTVVLATGAAGA